MAQKQYKKVFLLIAVLAIQNLFAITLMLNEVMSLNTQTLLDEDEDYSDWIELYNPSSEPVNLRGYGLSDNNGIPLKWIFPEITLPSRQFLLIFASSKDRRNPQLQLHTNFKLDSDGETLLLTSPEGDVADELIIPTLRSDISYGRDTEHQNQWQYFLKSTPGKINGTQGTDGETAMPEMSIQSGFYRKGVVVELAHTNKNARIRYTTDGSEPNQNSPIYQSGIVLSSSTIIRAKAYETGLLPSRTVSRSFFIDEEIILPVVSISTDPANLFDPDIGIYVEGNSSALGGYPSNPIGPPANYWEDWERPVHIDFFEADGSPGFSEDAGIKMAGKTSRTLPQKSFAIFFRDRYGADQLSYALFPNLPVTTFSSLVLRNGGSDNTLNQGGVHFRDGLAATLVQNLDLDVQAYRPCVVYLNGVYWGIYGLREKMNEDFLASHHGIDPKSVDILDDYHSLYPLVVEGDAEQYNQLIDFLLTHTLEKQSNADDVETQMDVDNYLTYMAVQIFFANQDGPGHNCKFWRPKIQEGRFCWMLYDTDHSFGLRLFTPNYHSDPDAFTDNTIAYYLEDSGPAWPNPPESTFLFRKILENEKFRHRFITRLADLMNDPFQSEKTISTVAEISGKLEKEMERHLERWGGEVTEWHSNLRIMENFLELRAGYLRDHLLEEFGLNGTAEIRIQSPVSCTGKVILNSIFIENLPWQGVYFQEIPLQLTAVPNAGYHFVKWKGDLTSDELSVEVIPDHNLTLSPVFERDRQALETVIINEINYYSAKQHNTEDWIELHNPSPESIDLSGWTFSASDDRYTFSQNLRLDSGKYLVLCRDSVQFRTVNSSMIPLTGNLNFGLSREGETLVLLNSKGYMIDSLSYEGKAPWPPQANGQGATLALKDPALDNNNPAHWEAGSNYGTPGASNKTTEIMEQAVIPLKIHLYPNYPNPFNSATTIIFDLNEEREVRLDILNAAGRKIRSLIQEPLPAGSHQAHWDGRDQNGADISTGLYFYRLRTGKEIKSGKMLLIQ